MHRLCYLHPKTSQVAQFSGLQLQHKTAQPMHEGFGFVADEAISAGAAVYAVCQSVC